VAELAEAPETIRLIERLAFRAWPAAETGECDGWRLRFAYGVTHRANSVWPNGFGIVLSLQEKIAAAEAFYLERKRPAIFQLCPASEPAQLDAVLQARGYSRTRETTVQIAPVAGVLSSLHAGRFPVTLEAACDDRWLAVYREIEGVEQDVAFRRAEIMRRIAPDAAYAIAWSGTVPYAVGSAVRDEGWVGLFNMATAVAHRRQGAARAVLGALAAWAREGGATNAYIQVMRDNTPALSLYHQVGFRTLYDYHYRVRAMHDR
jgi:ribosomal protein S18 acetylase RimI-like enzyme